MNDGRERIGLLPEHKYEAPNAPYRDTCGKCGARRVDAQLGLEESPDAYIAAMVGVFRQLRRVMRDDAVCFCNMGDSFVDKQLLMMPARLALALQADGWFIRSEIVWSKPNPMPESCRDRPTSAHEKVYLLAKKPRYFYDADAVREPTDEPWRSTGRLEQRGSKDVVAGVNNGFGLDGIRPREYNPAGRNLRNVWTIATAPYAQAHFATFPPELAARCIRAGTSQAGCCAACGAPWVRQTDTSYAKLTGSSGRNDQTGSNNWDGGGYPRMDKHVTTTGWAPSCQCEAETRPCVVLDCFSGAGTALLVADRLGRDAIGIDLSHAYVEMTRERLTADCPLFMAFEPSPPPAEDPDDMRMADLFAEAAE